MGVIYVLKNPSFPEYVKIGYADELEKRLDQLNRSECIPFAFRVYCTYEVSGRLKDKEVHRLIDKLRPELRSVDEYKGKQRYREFYNMSAEDAYDILYSIAEINGLTDNLKLIEANEDELEDEQLAKKDQESGSVKYTEEDVLISASSVSRDLYDKLKARIMNMGNIHLEPNKNYVSFKHKANNKNVCELKVYRDRTRVIINLKVGQLVDKLGIAEDLSGKGHHGVGDYIVDVYDDSLIDGTMELVEQAYRDKES